MTDNEGTPADTLTEWLSARSDDELAELLRLRPDLTIPPPPTLEVLAGRSEQRASVLRAAEDLDTTCLTVVELLAHEGADTAPVARARLDEIVGRRATKKAVDAALSVLRARALVRGTTSLTLVAAARDAVPWRVGRFFDVDASLTAEVVGAKLAEIDDRSRELLTTLTRSSSIGRTRDAAPGTPADRPVQRLLAAGLLTWLDDNTVELPPQVSQVLRGEPVTDPVSLAPPAASTTAVGVADVDAAAAGEALELLRHCEDIVDSLSRTPAPALKAGGLGVREIRRIAKAADLDEARVGLLVEVLAGAGLIAVGLPDPGPLTDIDDMWTPTPAVDAWVTASPAQRWATLAGAWLDLPRVPWLIGMRDANDKPIAALSDEARSAAAPRDRRIVLGVIADLASGKALATEDVVRIATWRRPRLAARLGVGPVSRYLAEAGALGVVGRGALSTPGRALIGDPSSAAAAMHRVLPEPIDHVLVQADLTVVAPGPLTPELAQRMATVADIESAGAATMYRIDERTLRRALDGGTTAAELHALFATHSRTPVPQSLTYLIDDVARRHGRLRAGVASSFVRCEDPALLAEVLSSPAAEALALRALAPTVAISQAPLADVLAGLRAAGFAPAGEDSSGTIVDVRDRGARVVPRRGRSPYRTPAVPTDEQLGRLVSEMRAGTRAGEVRRTERERVRSDGTRASGAATIALLQRAALSRSPISIGYVDAAGVSSNRVVEPVTVGGGQLDAWDPDAGVMRHFTLHRITSVALLA
ncbi:helicase-associated domain-containing protein [Rhodococcus sp. NBC_00294]|uniref:helicase-associated domain-containing protein n=1 Tax=Rhodococcus sp. NBC_00294 TaxID=2976004 RepID=UPI002E2B4891|nr:helicase-associated domain-containing protein [Rhodococcus sp. NBC_00294]